MKTIIEYLVTTYGIEASTSVTIVVTLFVFSSGIAINEILKSISRYSLRKNARLILYHTCTQIVSATKKQEKTYQKISSRFSFENMRLIEYDRVEISGVYLLSELSYEKLFEAYLIGFENLSFLSKKYRSKILSKIWSLGMVIKYIHERSYQEIDKIIEEYNLKNDLRNDSLSRLQKTIFELQSKVDGMQVTSKMEEYFRGIEDIFDSWKKVEDGLRPDIIHESLVLKLYEFDRRNHNKILSPILNPLLLETMHNFTNQKNYLNYVSLQFKYYARIMEQNSRFIRLLINLISKRFLFFKKSIFQV